MSESGVWQFVVDHWLGIIWAFIVVSALILLAISVIKLLNHRHLKKREMVWLELTPPASIVRTPEATEQLFSVIHGMYAARHLKEKLLGRSPVISFEITSTKQDGVRYLVQIDKTQASGLQKIVAAYMPDVKVKEINEPERSIGQVIEFKETGHYVLPLTLPLVFEQHDPLAYVTNAMTKLDEAEYVSMQLIITPVRLREASRLARKILSNEDILNTVQSGHIIWLQRFSNLINNVLWGAADMTSEVYHGTTTSNYVAHSSQSDADFKAQVSKRQRPARTLSAFELELMESMHHKVTQPLFRVNLRILVSSKQSKEYIAGLRSALDGYSVPLYQSLKSKANLPIIQKYRQSLANKRLPTLLNRNSMVLSTDEVASLYHFPSSRISRTDNLITSLSKTLPAPVSLKSGRNLAIVIGENQHHGVFTPIGLTDAERERHIYIIGGTGNGKTTMLLYSIVQDIKNGKGIAVLDPHGDLADTILQHIPAERIGDVIYMNPDDLSYPIGMNLLELPDDITGDDLLREKDLITESAISVLRKIFSEDDSGGHRIEYILRNAIQTALTLEKSTLFTIFRLLNDSKYRREVVRNLEDENLRNFWKNEIGKAGEMQRVKMAAGITAKIGRFLFSASARRVLEQEKSTIDFDKILDDGKIFICNFSKGLLGEDTSTLFGTTVLAKLQLASLRRARISASNRRPFYLYVDEFQNFATTSFTQMLSEARKYKLFLTMAEQSTSQQDQQRLVDVILANVGTVICFRSGSPADERLVLPLFSPYIEQGEIANLPAYSFYARISAVHSQEPMSGVTLLLEDIGNTVTAKHVVEESRKKYSRSVEEQAQKKLEAQSVAKPDDKPKTQRRLRKKNQPIKTVGNVSAGAKSLG